MGIFRHLMGILGHLDGHLMDIWMGIFGHPHGHGWTSQAAESYDVDGEVKMRCCWSAGGKRRVGREQHREEQEEAERGGC